MTPLVIGAATIFGLLFAAIVVLALDEDDTYEPIEHGDDPHDDRWSGR